ncbi:hypothetical protein LCGC14_0838690 [marine sediment metagenome]|uniref:Methyltransferase domain-containing protein n=1 Tax=marine sediment metagenome TaxID=412755 RepID=A0A0F9PDU2_9ZZZZ
MILTKTRMSVLLTHPDGQVDVHQLRCGKKHVVVRVREERTYVPRRECDTSYPVELVRAILNIKGPAWVCDEIMRDEDPTYIERHLLFGILAYVPETAFVGRKILDFGCGCGASTMVLARMFPQTQIIGVDLDADFLDIARHRASHYGLRNVHFYLSPDGSQLPKGIERFPFVILNGVYEHLLPHERQVLMPKLWSLMKPGGILFVTETPHTYFPVERHTSGLPLINYMPSMTALALARRFSRNVQADESWQSLLRRGIRGGTEAEIMDNLVRQCADRPILLQPSRLGLRDAIDLWSAMYGPKCSASAMRLAVLLLRLTRACLGIALVHSLSLAIKKGP